MAKLKGILLTEGMHGMISQVEGLAKALDIDFTHHKVELNHFWKLIPPNLSPVSQGVFKKINHDDFDVIISCGRKSVIPSIHLKNTANKKAFNIHIQDPKVDLNHFDFIVAPEHDGIEGHNVISTKGAIHYLTENEISENEDYLKSLIKKIEIIWDSAVDEVIGDGDPKNVTGIKVKNLKTNNVEEMKIDGLFIAIGHDPATSLFKEQLDMDKEGYLLTKPDSTETNIPGVYAAGDVKDKTFRQAVTAAGMGCMAALEAEKFLSH